MTSISRKMAEFTAGLLFDDIPQDAIYEAKRFLLDSIGCALAATQNDDMQAMYRFTEKLGGTPEATVIGTGTKTNAPNAALMNGLLIRALDYNDIYWVQDPSHPSDLLGAVLAAAEANGRNGADALVATNALVSCSHAGDPGSWLAPRFTNAIRQPARRRQVVWIGN